MKKFRKMNWIMVTGITGAVLSFNGIIASTIVYVTNKQNEKSIITSQQANNSFQADYSTNKDSNKLPSEIIVNLKNIADLNNYINLFENQTINYTLDHITDNDLLGNITVFLKQTNNNPTLSKEISFTISGFNRSAAKIFSKTYKINDAKSKNFLDQVVNELKTYNDLKQYVNNLPDVSSNAIDLTIKSVVADNANATINVVLSQQYNGQINQDISFRIFGFYNYSTGTFSQLPPANDDTVKTLVPDLSNKNEFNKNIVAQWNAQFAYDALFAIARIYNNSGDQIFLTNNMKEYIKAGYDASVRNSTNNISIGWYMASAVVKNSRVQVQDIVLNPEYNVQIIRENNNFRLSFNWIQKNYKERFLISGEGWDHTATVTGNAYFDIDPTVKPTIDANGNAVVNTQIHASISNKVSGLSFIASNNAIVSINILDALYYYYNSSLPAAQTIKSQMFNISADFSKNLYAIYGSILAILDNDSRFQTK